ncbi:glycosyltransferase [Turicibacter sanguinis]|nr:glycosyltransferase [Turicibacter sanguinis]
MLNKITVLTPTYNRGNLIINCYNSLVKQTYKNFEWLVIDDGSLDNTEIIMKKLISEKKIDIRFFKKPNGGKHTALNYGFDLCKGDLTIIVDSDDYLTENALQVINELWSQNYHIENLHSIAFLRQYSDGTIIGDKFPKDYFLSNHVQCRFNLKIKGDKAEVYNTNILKTYKFPVFEGEKFLSEDIVWTRMGKVYKTLYINLPIYVTEYLEGGLTKSGRKLRIQCPRGAIEAHSQYLSTDFNWSIRVKHMILSITYQYFLGYKTKEILSNRTINKMIALISIFPGYLLFKFWEKKYM